MKRFLLSILGGVIGLSAFSQSPSRLVSLQSTYPLVVGEYSTGGVMLSNGCLYMHDVEVDSLPRYEIGYIDVQTVRYSDYSHGFVIKADSLHSPNVTFAYEVKGEQQPEGVIDFNAATGRFTYYPKADEYKSFVISFSATNGSTSVLEDVEFDLVPQTVSEVEIFQSRGVLPSAGDYTIVVETPTEKFLNNQNRTAYSVNISGKDVIFDDALQNKVLKLSKRTDIYELNIYAERLIIRSALSFPQTDITIYAKELIFEDKYGQLSSISTSPLQEKIVADGQGRDGAKAGDLSLYVKDFKADAGKRFILIGAQGQSTNRNGTPGKGGNGGTVKSTIDISGYCDMARGNGGIKYDVAANGAAVAGPIIGYGDMGTMGTFNLIKKPYAYLHPYYIAAVMRHANDAYINNCIDEVAETYLEYHDLIDEYLNSNSGNTGGTHEGIIDGEDGILRAKERMKANEDFEWLLDDNETETKLELQSDLIEMESVMFKIGQGLDYFGNPQGWTPLLSFEVYMENYKNEVNRAIPTLYMYYWMNHVDLTLQRRVEASKLAAEETEQNLDNNMASLNSLVFEVPVLQDETEEVSQRIVDVTEKLEKLQDELMRKAKHNVRKRNRLKKIFGIVKTVANVLPITGALGTAIGEGIDVALKFADNIINLTGGEGYSTFYSSIKDMKCDENFFSGIDTAVTNAKTNAKSHNMQGVVDAATDLNKTIKPLFENLKYLQETLSKSSAPNGEVQAEFNKLMAQSAQWQALKAEIEELNARKEELLNRMNQVLSDMTTTVAEINSDALAYDVFNRQTYMESSKRDINAMLYLEKMKQRENNRLLKYHYYLRKAYEYRLLKPYEGDEFNVVGLFERFEKLGLAVDSVVNKEAYDALGSTFQKILSEMTDNIIYDKSYNPSEQATHISIVLTKDQLDAINAGDEITLNVQKEFQLYEDNVRILDIEIERMDKHIEGNASKARVMDLNLAHSGTSIFRKEGNLYWFNHMSPRTTNPHKWGIRYNAVTDKTEAIHPSPSSTSLLSYLIGAGDNVMLFSLPSAWSDITISKNVTGGADIVIDSLVLNLTYSFDRRPDRIRNIDIHVSDGLMPYIACSEEDVNGRSSGTGHIQRSYRQNSKRVTFTAAEKYGTYYFTNWTDQFGRVVTDKTMLTIDTKNDQVYTANYERKVPVLDVPDTIRVGSNDGIYTVKVRNIGLGNTEMDWYVSDEENEQWVHLDGGEAEGIDDGHFTLRFDANTTGIDRVDSIEVFAPETDLMSKMVYIVQDGSTPDFIEAIENIGDDVQIHSNLTGDSFTIKGDGILSVCAYSLTGREVGVQHCNSCDIVTMDLQTVPHGVYLLVIKAKKGTICRKVLKK